MASISPRPTTAAETTDTRTAGGKISRNRRSLPSSRTPYSRPSPLSEVEDEETQIQNPNWLSSLIYPAKAVVSGVGKFWSFFESHDASDDDDSENDADDDESVEVGADGLDKVLSPFSKSANKQKIEQLVKEQTFSREEGNQLIKLVKSRTMYIDGNLGVATPPGRTTAIMEAKKWLQEKRSCSKKKLEAELDLTSSQLNRSEKGSPADMAKSYMQNHPAWASPSFKQVDLGSPSTFGMLHSKEETPSSTVRNTEGMQLKRTSFSSGSWNLLEQIRRVRSKASEELLAATPLTKTSFSLFSKKDTPQDISGSRGDMGAGLSRFTLISTNVPEDAANNSLLRYHQDADAVQSVEMQQTLEPVDLSSNNDFEVSEPRSTTEANGFVRPVSSIADGAVEPKPSKGETELLVGSGQEEHEVHVDDSNPLPVSADVPSTNPTDLIVNGSQSSSNVQEENLSQELSQPTADGPASIAKDVQERKPATYPLRDRARAQVRTRTQARGRG